MSFYEEFPTKENIDKLRLVKFKTRIFMAARSVREFRKLEKQVKKIKKDVKIGYWPIIPNSYWISPFSNRRDLIELFNELDKIKNLILIDLEMPLKKKMILKNIFYFFQNKRLIKKFMKKNKKRITTAEFPASIFSIFIKILGLDYKIKTEKSLMWYSSMRSNLINKKIKKCLKNLKNKPQYSISLGTIATGVLGNEPILSPKNLENDLDFVKRAEFSKVILFRLGGLNKNYIKVINKFQAPPQ